MKPSAPVHHDPLGPGPVVQLAVHGDFLAANGDGQHAAAGGTLVAYEISQETGSRIHEVRLPLSFSP